MVCDSNAILLYLAEKTGQFLPPNTPAARAQMHSWLMFVSSPYGLRLATLAACGSAHLGAQPTIPETSRPLPKERP
jgi:glutathione S-transferase